MLFSTYGPRAMVYITPLLTYNAMNIFQSLPAQGGCWGWSGLGMGGMMGYWWVLPILILVGLYFAFYPRRLAYTNREDSMEIARRRYARGEISKDKFGDIQRNLK